MGTRHGFPRKALPGEPAAGHASRRTSAGTARGDEVRLTVRKLILSLLAAAGALAAADFDSEVRPLIRTQCLACHQESNRLGGLSLETLGDALQGGASGPSIVAGQPDQSLLLARMLLPADAAGAMPPTGPRPSAADLAAVRSWIAQGAAWSVPVRVADPTPPIPDDDSEMALARRIHALIASRAKSESGESFESYREAVPGTDASLEMMPIPAGEFVLGTASDEAGRGVDEGPQVRVAVDAFWMAAHEVSWDAFRRFMLREADARVDPDKVAAAVSSPTPPYVEMSFGMGITGYPAISMTQHAASKYAQWLSAKTGRFYRLPTEAEWEYACRAGSSAAYSFGNSADRLDEHGWYWENSDAQYRPTGSKTPNAWGLYDMHGNVWEWTLDRYEPHYPASEQPLDNPWARPLRLYPRVVRGGSWMDDAPALRCGARRASSEDWKMQDPQLPKSIWYHTDAQWLGFRLVRPRLVPPAEMMHAYWNSATGAK